jgi:hypothetical protein
MLGQTSVARVASLADRLAERTLARLHGGELSREEVRSSSDIEVHPVLTGQEA